MATPPSDDSVQLFKLLADGQWHPYLEIRDRLALTVPPGRARRKYDERMRNSKQAKNNPGYDTMTSEDDRIWIGAKACAQVCITSWKERGRGIEQRGRQETREIRIQPGFKSWGLAESPVAPEGDGKSEGVPEVPLEASEGSEGRSPGVDVYAEPERASLTAQRAQEAVLGDRPAGPIAITAGQPRTSSPVTQSDSQWGIGRFDSCIECGMPVMDLMTHGTWHADQARATRMILERLSGVTLSSDVVAEQFERFQDGMQEWMSMQFAQLELELRLWMRSNGRWSTRNSQSGKPE